MHLVEFARPAAPVRLSAKPCDLLPTNIDICTEDMPARYAEMTRAGHQCRSSRVEMPGPAATGILHINHGVADVAPINARLARAGIAFAEHGRVKTLQGSGVLLSFSSAAGLRIEVHGER
jgi:hypothetical protein